MEVVKMVASVAGEEVFVGECHPARARVLVKKQLASWKDGKILLHVLQVHDKLLAANPEAARGPLDDENVSKQEMERRLAWFRSFMDKSARVLVRGHRPLPSKEETAAWKEKHLREREEAWAREVHASEETRIKYNIVEPTISDEEAASYFEDVPLPEELEEVDLRYYWEAAPGTVVSEVEVVLSQLWGEDVPVVKRQPRAKRVYPDIEQVTRESYQAQVERDRRLVREHAESFGGDTPPVEVATMDQIRHYWAKSEL